MWISTAARIASLVVFSRRDALARIGVKADKPPRLPGQVEQAQAAWDKGNELVQKLPQAGAYEFDRYCFAQLRQVLDASPSPVPGFL